MAVQTPLSEVTTFSKLLPIAEKAESKLSIFGSRYVCIGSEDETLDLADLVSHMNRLLWKNMDFPGWDRTAVRQISKLINRLYKVSDEQVKTSNLFTWLATFLREFFRKNIFWRNSSLHTRWIWKECKHDYFLPNCKRYKYYTPKQFAWRFWYFADPKNESLDFYHSHPNIWFRPRKDPSIPRIVRTHRASEENMWNSTSSTIEIKDSKKT